MIFVFEGPSKAGKTTIQDYLKNNFTISPNEKKYYYPKNWLFYDGFSLLDIGPNKWDDYIHFENAVFGKLNYYNKDKVFILDRFFSEIIYNEDNEKWLRTFEHHNACIIYIDANNKVLKKRNTKDSNIEKTRKRYNNILLPKFDHIKIKNNGDISLYNVSEKVHNFIVKKMEENL